MALSSPPFPRYSLLLLSFISLSSFVPTAKSSGDAEALMVLKSSMDRLNSLGWGGSDFCKWEGIRECIKGRVTKLVLEHLNLSGTLDGRTLSRLDQLRVLSFKENSIFGPIPNFSGLVNLKSLFLNDNNFSGDFPASISVLHRLKVVVLSGNHISGGIPESLLKLRRLYVLHLQDNRFNGGIPPLNQTSLRFFNVSNNQLSGNIPATPILDRFNSSSFSGNLDLCGEQVHKPCNGTNHGFAPAISPSSYPQVSSRKFKHHAKHLVGIVLASVGGFLLLGILVLVLVVCMRKGSNAGELTSKGVVEGGAEERGEGGNSNSNSNSNNNGGAKVQSGFSWEGVGGGVGSLVFCGAGAEQMSYSLEDLLKASAETLGRGTVGSTYKAVMESGFIVTVKRLKDARYPRVEEFRRHMDVIGRLSHPNLVPLRAYFQAKEERLLVYDYFPNGSLFSLIHGMSLSPF
ncbi:hypothetical protein RJ639_007788 [Escallonia herrerae]|uniref:Protein kinase domain-containing protein n=1 Tax=Escallonia herrerae TaxID=1293975 RepID=A0AA89AYC5_9ASTE|nr:hypothetical protein RJ639_007788 [Escallonia herrerae]